MFQRTRAVPRPLALDVKHLAVLVLAHAERAAQAAAQRDGLPVRCNLQRPPAEQRFRVVRFRQPERDVEVPRRVKLRAERELVIVPKTPLVAHGVEAVRASVAIRVRDAGDFRGVRGVERAVAMREAQHFIQPAGETMHGRTRVFVHHAAHQENFPAPRAHRQPTIRQRNETPRLQINALGQRDVDDAVVSRLPFRRAPGIAEIIRRRGGEREHTHRDD